MYLGRRGERALIGGEIGSGTPETGKIERESASFDEVYREHRGFIHARCRRILGCDELAEDATQEISLKLLAHWSELPPGEPTRRWLQRVTTNYCLNQLRNEKRRLDLLVVPEETTAPFHESIADRELVTKLLASLPAELRLVGWLSHVDECDQERIAEELRISRRTVVARLSTFRARAKRILGSL